MHLASLMFWCDTESKICFVVICNPLHIRVISEQLRLEPRLLIEIKFDAEAIGLGKILTGLRQ